MCVAYRPSPQIVLQIDQRWVDDNQIAWDVCNTIVNIIIGTGHSSQSTATYAANESVIFVEFEQHESIDTGQPSSAPFASFTSSASIQWPYAFGSQYSAGEAESIVYASIA